MEQLPKGGVPVITNGIVSDQILRDGSVEGLHLQKSKDDVGLVWLKLV